MTGLQRQKPHWMAILAVIGVGILARAGPAAVFSPVRSNAGLIVILMVVLIVMLARQMQRV